MAVRDSPLSEALSLALFASAVWSFDFVNPTEVTNTLVYGMLVFQVSYRRGLRPGMLAALWAVTAHLTANHLAPGSQPTYWLILDGCLEPILLLLVAIAADRFRQKGVQLEQTLGETGQLHAELSSQMRAARRVQAALLGTPPTSVPGATVKIRSLIARELGGDFFFLKRLGDDTLFCVADVSGKGPQAALVAAVARGLCEEIAHSAITPAELLRRLEQRLLGLLPETMFITCYCASFKPTRGELIYANAGHDPPLLRMGKTGPVQPLPCNALPLGVLETQQIEDVLLEFPPESLLLCYSDGLTDAQIEPDIRVGDLRVAELFRNFSGTPAQLVQRLESLLPSVLHDDVTLLALQAEPAERLWDVLQGTCANPGVLDHQL